MNDVPTWGQFEWTAKRIDKLREIAKSHGTAAMAAEAVGLPPERAHVCYRIAKREGFAFTNVGRKRDDGVVFVRLNGENSAALTSEANKAGVPRREFAAKLLGATLSQGSTFIGNLLDDRD